MDGKIAKGEIVTLCEDNGGHGEDSWGAYRALRDVDVMVERDAWLLGRQLPRWHDFIDHLVSINAIERVGLREIYVDEGMEPWRPLVIHDAHQAP